MIIELFHYLKANTVADKQFDQEEDKYLRMVQEFNQF